MAKASGELGQWKVKYEAASLAREDELEEQRRKFAAKLAESQEQLEAANARGLSLEKSKV